MKRIVGIICLLGIFPSFLLAQYMEAGVLGGFSQYNGDLLSGYEQRENHLSFGVFGRYNWSRRLAFKAQFSQFTLSGSDAHQKASDSFESSRNLSFKSKLLELAVLGEWNLTSFDVRDQKTTAPYVFGGLALFHNNPRAELEGRWYKLQELGTEGQTLEGGKKYSKLNIGFPVGLGLKISLSERVNIGVELGYRFTLTDYIDDVSGNYPDLVALATQNPVASRLSFRSPEILPQLAGNPVGKPRGNASNKDSYYMGNLTISFNLVEGYDLEFDESLKKFSPNYVPDRTNLKEVKKGLRKKEKRKSKKEKE